MTSSPKIILTLLHIPIFITIIYAFLVYQKLGKELKAFAHFLFLSGVVAIGSLGLWLLSINNMPLLHFYVCFGFILQARFYRQVFDGLINRHFFTGMVTIFTIFTLINSTLIQNLLSFNSYALTVQSILIIILSLSTFLLLLNDVIKETRTSVIPSLNWINSGLFIYYSSSLLIFYFGDLITKFSSSTMVKYTWLLHGFFSTIMYVCSFLGLWKRPRN
jgi:hypothetical protein